MNNRCNLKLSQRDLVGKHRQPRKSTRYSGTIVPLRYYRKDPRVRSVMIEINRGLYLNESFERSPGLERVRKDIAEILEIA